MHSISSPTSGHAAERLPTSIPAALGLATSIFTFLFCTQDGSEYTLKEENGKVRFLEVKGVANIEDGIRMTKEEIIIALGFPNKYDLLIVENH